MKPRWRGMLRGALLSLAAASLAFCLALVALLVTPLGTGVAASMMRSTPLAELPVSDAVVVLGGDPVRAVDALRVYRAGKAPLIIASGDVDETLQILAAGQVPPEAIRVDREPLRTMDHPRTIRSVPGVTESSRLILVTSKLHQRRALEIFRRAGYTQVAMCSLEWEQYQASPRRRLSHISVACLFYEFAAGVKSCFVD